ncbi:hypothetical protein KP509_34G055900 [Ceratopteris richardii]|uniref:Uncharacterized protein n=1 Tax=Ceratopteris richardii TaxID=49495 RepID=A0A8T2QLE0_CERRI|nr:hypothetical protein KP509_34G055900 [Ceratopteris richardii]
MAVGADSRVVGVNGQGDPGASASRGRLTMSGRPGTSFCLLIAAVLAIDSRHAELCGDVRGKGWGSRADENAVAVLLQLPIKIFLLSYGSSLIPYQPQRRASYATYPPYPSPVYVLHTLCRWSHEILLTDPVSCVRLSTLEHRNCTGCISTYDGGTRGRRPMSKFDATQESSNIRCGGCSLGHFAWLPACHLRGHQSAIDG